MRFSRLRVLFISCAMIGVSAAILEACSDDATTDVTPTGDANEAGTDARTTRRDSGGEEEEEEDSDSGTTKPKDSGGGGGNDGGAGTCGPDNATKTGETCVGFGAKPETCDAGCNPYGYLCFVGGPPGFTNCHTIRTGGLGNTYCCSENKCVAEPDQDTQCLDAGAGKPHRFQCPPNATGSGNVTPPAGCVEHVSGTSAIEKFYCCP